MTATSHTATNGGIVEELRAMNSRTVDYCLELGEVAAREIELLRDQVEGLKKPRPMADCQIVAWMLNSGLVVVNASTIQPGRHMGNTEYMPAGMRERFVELGLIREVPAADDQRDAASQGDS